MGRPILLAPAATEKGGQCLAADPFAQDWSTRLDGKVANVVGATM
jgi:hypothetical protein